MASASTASGISNITAESLSTGLPADAKIWLVGGAVRDQLLGITPKDRDWVVTGATAEQMLAAGFVRADNDFPVFIRPDTGEEYALARVEYKTGCGYKGFEIYAGPDVTLEQDLKRRDFTINAMAQNDNGDIFDPFHGQNDLQNGKIRHVSPAFTEDPLRLLRGARFAARFHRFGFHIAHETHRLMKQMATSGELQALTPSRIWSEMVRALAEPNPEVFFRCLYVTGALKDPSPELGNCLKTDPATNHSVYPAVLENLAKLSRSHQDPIERWAALLLALYQCEPNTDVRKLSERFNAPAAFRDTPQSLVALHDALNDESPLDASTIYQLFETQGALRDPDAYRKTLALAQALHADNGKSARLAAALTAVQQVKPATFLQQGLKGGELGAALKKARISAIRQTTGEPNHEQPD